MQLVLINNWTKEKIEIKSICPTKQNRGSPKICESMFYLVYTQKDAVRIAIKDISAFKDSDVRWEWETSTWESQ